MIVQSGCHVFEYSWEAKGPRRSSNLTETVISVFFDHGAQQLFSAVRINIGHKDSVSTKRIVGKWKFAPGPSPPSVTNRTSSVPLKTKTVGPNPSPLHVLDINIEIHSLFGVRDMWDVTSNGLHWDYQILPPDGGLTFKDSRTQLPRTLLEIDQPLTVDTHSVSVSFTSSPRLYTPGQSGSGHPLDNSSTVGRVVRVRPPHIHKTVRLPTEVLLMIFQNFSKSFDVSSQWRRDLLSCALVCKQWTCALDLLLSDFRYPDARTRQTPYPPEICSFASMLALRPSLALSITHLSPGYFFRHARWTSLSCTMNASESPLLPRPSRPPSERTHIEQFVASFLSIVRLSKNLRSLSFLFHWNIGLPNDSLDALRGLAKIEELDVTGEFNAVHRTYLAVWPSLKYLTMSIPESAEQNDPVPTTPPPWSLTRAVLFRRFTDEQLNYLLSSSSSSLERLLITCSDWLTHSGLFSVLQGVSKSLVVLRIGRGGSEPDENEEHVLDAVIVEMVRLEYLDVTSTHATYLMIDRRAKAFKRSPLPVIKLAIEILWGSQCNGLRAAVGQVWPGWLIKVIEG